LAIQPERLAEIVVVDNASTDGSADALRHDFPEIALIRNASNVGFARGANLGFAATRGDFVLLLNPDTVVPTGAVAELARRLDVLPRCGACAPRLVTPELTAQRFAYGDEPTPFYLLHRVLWRLAARDLHDWDDPTMRAVGWVSGACVLLRRQALADAGAFDERFFLYFEDVDLCLRLRDCGWSVLRCGEISVIHVGGASGTHSSRAGAYRHSLALLYRKRYGPLAAAALRACLAGREAWRSSVSR
jgi:N-acetylglucosaminyl-diphospho-decaprenol L-rhamnosyltransferase